jgi:CRP/FNR family transcriptional regulator, anaerobic regulatory protein
VRDRAACAVLSEDERDALAAASRIRTLTRGETLFAAGDDQVACATLVSGALDRQWDEQAGGRQADDREEAQVEPAGRGIERLG